MLTQLRGLALQIRSALWFRPTVASVTAAGVAWGIAGVDGALPAGIAIPSVDPELVKELLTLLASAMLTVTTVTLSALMVVLNMAVSQASPRALPGLMADEVTQNALSTFVATFVFALFGLVGLGLALYDRSGLTVLFGTGVVLTVLALRYLVHWMHHIAGTLRLGNIVVRVQHDTNAALDRFLEAPFLGAKAGPERDGPPDGAQLLACRRSAYLCSIDTQELQAQAERHDLRIELLVRPGDFMHPHRPALALTPGTAPLSDKDIGALLDCLLLGEERSYHQDPLLGLQILGEIGSRALSPGINDPKTAIICLDRLEALLCRAAQPPVGKPGEVEACDRLSLPALGFDKMLDRALHSLARDGAKSVEVVLRQISALERIGLAATDAAVSPVLLASLERTVDFAAAGLALESDRAQIRKAATRVRRRLNGNSA